MHINRQMHQCDMSRFYFGGCLDIRLSAVLSLGSTSLCSSRKFSALDTTLSFTHGQFGPDLIWLFLIFMCSMYNDVCIFCMTFAPLQGFAPFNTRPRVTFQLCQDFVVVLFESPSCPKMSIIFEVEHPNQPTTPIS